MLCSVLNTARNLVHEPIRFSSQEWHRHPNLEIAQWSAFATDGYTIVRTPIPVHAAWDLHSLDGIQITPLIRNATCETRQGDFHSPFTWQSSTFHTDPPLNITLASDEGLQWTADLVTTDSL